MTHTILKVILSREIIVQRIRRVMKKYTLIVIKKMFFKNTSKILIQKMYNCA